MKAKMIWCVEISFRLEDGTVLLPAEDWHTPGNLTPNEKLVRALVVRPK